MTFTDLQSNVAQWVKKNFPNTQPHRALLGVTEEVGELAHAHLKMEQGIRGTPEQHKAAKEDAIGDIMIYLADYCQQNNISLSHCVSVAWNEIKDRDWIQYPLTGKPEPFNQP